MFRQHPTMRLASVMTWTLVCAWLWLSGCKGLPGFSDEGKWLPPQRSTGLVAAPDALLPDAPVAIGFTVLKSRSRGYVTDSGIRQVEHVYQGRATQADTVQYYRQQLGHHGWQHLSEQMVNGTANMRYTKGPENLNLQISQRRGIVTVHLDLHDKNLPGPDPVKTSLETSSY